MLEYEYECGKVRMVNGNSSCCRPLQGDLDLYRERLLERDVLALISLVHMTQDNWLVISTCALWIKPYIEWATCAQILTKSS